MGPAGRRWLKTRMDETVPESARAERQREPRLRGPAPPKPGSRSARDQLVRLAYRFLWNRDEAEEVAQDALMTAHERARDLREVDKWWPWVCRIVVQRCRLRGRDRHQRDRHAEPYAVEVTRREREAGDADSSELVELVKSLLGELPPRQYEVIVLHHLHGMGYDEVAEVLGIAAATARVHARAGREALRKLVLNRSPHALDVCRCREHREP